MKPIRLVFALCACAVAVGAPKLASEAAAPSRPKSAKPAVRFDAMFRLKSKVGFQDATLFARYWVAPDYYHVAVVWREPKDRSGAFSIYPPSLTFGSDIHGFSVSHDLFPSHTQAYERPIGTLNKFVRMLGDYPVGDVRFAEQEALAARVHSSELPSPSLSTTPESASFKIPETASWHGERRDVRAAKTRSMNGSVSRLELYDERDQLLQSNDYERSGSRLTRQTAHLPARPIKVGFRGKGARLQVGQREFQVESFDMKRHDGSRRAEVDYAPFGVGGRTFDLPKAVNVFHGATGRLMRSVVLTDIQEIDLTSEQARAAAAEYGRLTPERLLCRTWVKKRLSGESAGLTAAERESAVQMRDAFERSAAETSESVGETLRRLGLLTDLSRLLDDGGLVSLHFVEYLETLQGQGLTDLLLEGGSTAVAESLKWRRIDEAEALLRLWLDAAEPLDLESVLAHAAKALAVDSYWPTVRLLDRVAERGDAAPDLQLRLASLKLKALQEIQRRLDRKGAPEGKAPYIEEPLIRMSTTPEQLSALIESQREAVAALSPEAARPTSPTASTEDDRIRDLFERHRKRRGQSENGTRRKGVPVPGLPRQ